MLQISRPKKAFSAASSSSLKPSKAVSYTHLDVYKRQSPHRWPQLSLSRLKWSISIIRQAAKTSSGCCARYFSTDVYKRQGVQPILGYCVGAKKWERFRKVMRQGLLYALILGVVLTVVCFFGSGAMVSCLLYTSRCV